MQPLVQAFGDGRNPAFTTWAAYHRESNKVWNRKTLLVGGWPTPLKNISQLGWLFPMYGKKKCSKPTISLDHYENNQMDNFYYSISYDNAHGRLTRFQLCNISATSLWETAAWSDVQWFFGNAPLLGQWYYGNMSETPPQADIRRLNIKKYPLVI